MSTDAGSRSLDSMQAELEKFEQAALSAHPDLAASFPQAPARRRRYLMAAALDCKDFLQWAALQAAYEEALKNSLSRTG